MLPAHVVQFIQASSVDSAESQREQPTQLMNIASQVQ